MQTFKKRDRVVTAFGDLGYIVHVYDKEGHNVNVKRDGRIIFTGYSAVLRPATSKDFKKGRAEIWKNDKKKWNYRLIAKNTKQVGGSQGQGYSNRVDMIDVLNNNHIDFEIVQK